MPLTMEHYKLKSNLIVFAAIVLSFIGCEAKPTESQIELALDKQVIEKPFSLKDYSEKDFDSIFVIHPYFDTNRKVFLNLRMSKKLKSLCNVNTGSELISTILFIKNSRVEAYTIVERKNADFASIDFEKQHLFPFDQKFIMDKERDVHLYNE